MNRSTALIFALAAGAAATSVTPDATGEVKRTVANCSAASAILAGSRGGDHAQTWASIAEVVRKERRMEIVDDMPRDVVERVTFRQWSVRNPTQSGPDTMYVVHCGHGGTCNRVAAAFNEAFPQSQPSPIVHCGDLSNVLENPTQPNLGPTKK